MHTNKTNIPPGAGIILLKEDAAEPSGFKVLSLVCKNINDIPKGAIDPGETAFEAAVRETYEEAKISDLEFRWGLKNLVYEQLTFFIAVTTQEPTITANPHTGIIEHDYAVWLTWDEFEKNTKNFIIPGITWGYKIVQGML